MMTVLASDDWLMMAVITIPGAFVVTLGFILDTVRKTAQTRQREQSRREIAAYIAEGSMSAEDGARLMAAGESIKDKLGVKA